MLRIGLTAAAIAVFVGGTRLETHYAEGSALRFETRTSLDMETTKFEMTRDGEPVESPGGGGSSSTYERKLAWVDKTKAVEDGKPTKVERTFEELVQHRVTRFGDTERESDGESPFEDVTLEIDAAKDGKATAKVLSGKDPGAKLLEAFLPELPLDSFLPGGEKEKDAKWDLDKDQIRQALLIHMDPVLFPPKEEESAGGGGGGGGRGGMRGGRGNTARLLDTAEWTGKAKFIAVEEHDGVSCAVIEVKLEAEGELPEPEPRNRRGGDAFDPTGEFVALKSTYEIKAEGKLYFAIEAKRPVALDLDGTVRTDSDTERKFQDQTVHMVSAQEGKLEIRCSVKKAE